MARALLLLVVLVAPPLASAAPVEQLPSPLPGGFGAIAWATPEAAFVLTERECRPDPCLELWRVDAESLAATRTGLRLPRELLRASVAWTGEAAYVVGGWPRCVEPVCSPSQEVWRVDPAADEALLVAHVPVAMRDSVAGWTGEELVVFASLLDGSGAILRYDPVLGAWEGSSAQAPGEVATATLVWDGSVFHLLGGSRDVEDGEIVSTEYVDTIWRYDPATDEAVLRPERLSAPTWGAVGWWDGERVRLAGGASMTEGGGVGTAPLVAYDPAEGTVEARAADLFTLALPAVLPRGDDEVLLFVVGDEITPLVLRLDPPDHEDVVPATWRLGLGTTLAGATIVGDASSPFSARVWTYDAQARDAVARDVLFPGGHFGLRPVYAAAATLGQTTYVFGGVGDAPDAIWRVDPGAPEASRLAGALPFPSIGAAAWVAPDGRVLLAGGFDGARYRDEVLAFDPATGAVEPTPLRLPTPRAFAGLATDGARAWLAGGYDGAPFDEVVEVDASNLTARVLGVRLPSARAAPAAAWSGESVVVLGGVDADGRVLDEIVTLDPARDAGARMRARLPEPRHSALALWDGTRVHVLAGQATVNAPLLYDPAADEPDATLPAGGEARAPTPGREPRADAPAWRDVWLPEDTTVEPGVVVGFRAEAAADPFASVAWEVDGRQVDGDGLPHGTAPWPPRSHTSGFATSFAKEGTHEVVARVREPGPTGFVERVERFPIHVQHDRSVCDPDAARAAWRREVPPRVLIAGADALDVELRLRDRAQGLATGSVFLFPDGHRAATRLAVEISARGEPAYDVVVALPDAVPAARGLVELPCFAPDMDTRIPPGFATALRRVYLVGPAPSASLGDELLAATLPPDVEWVVVAAPTAEVPEGASRVRRVEGCCAPGAVAAGLLEEFRAEGWISDRPPQRDVPAPALLAILLVALLALARRPHA